MLRAACVLSLVLSFSPITLAQNPADQTLITLERTSCYGECPVYKLTIHGDGSVDYEGRKFVRVTGKQKTKIKPSEVESLLQEFKELDYFGLDDDYSTIRNSDGTVSVATDLPTTIVSLSADGRSKEVVDYVGAPEKLRFLERKIYELAGSKRWVSIDAPTVHSECRLGWDLRSNEARKLVLHAAESGDADVLKAFIDEGADVDAASGSITPLQLARNVRIVKLLIDAGANVNAGAKTGLGPPLNRASGLGDADSISALIKAGAKVNNKTSDGITALMLAAEHGNSEAVKILLAAGADALAKDNSGHDALHYADYGLQQSTSDEIHPSPFSDRTPDYKNKFRIIEDLLLAAGATPKKTTAK